MNTRQVDLSKSAPTKKDGVAMVIMDPLPPNTTTIAGLPTQKCMCWQYRLLAWFGKTAVTFESMVQF